MPVIGATQLEPVNILGSYVQGLEGARANKLAQQQAALAQQQQARAEQQFQMQMADRDRELKRQELQEKRDSYALLGQIAGTAVDQPTFDQALATLRDLGVDTTNVSPVFDAKKVKAFRDGTMTEAQRLDLEIRRGTLNVQQIQAQTAKAEQDRLTREAMAGPKREKPPEGYRYTEAGNLEFIPGGPKDPANIAGTDTELAPKIRAKREELYPKATSAFNSATRDIDKQIETAKKLRDHPGLDSITGGIEGRIGSIRGTSTAAQSLYDNLLSKGTLTSLTQLRAASETGGALGNVSNQDSNLLRTSVGALDQSQPKETLQERLDEYISDLEFAKENITDAYEKTYAYRSKRPRSVRGDPSKRKPSGTGGQVATTSSGTSYQVLED
jgi:hypothetical protein